MTTLMLPGGRRLVALVPADMDAATNPAAAIDAARLLAEQEGSSFEVLVLGQDPTGEATVLAQSAGADKVWQVGHTGLRADSLPEAWATAFAVALRDTRFALAGPCLVIVPIGTLGEEVGARLAQLLSAVILGRCIGLRSDGATLVVSRSTHGGRMLIEFSSDATLCVATLRAARKAPVAGPSSTTIDAFTIDRPLPAPLLVNRIHTGQRLPNVEGARIVVSGGRGVNNEGGFQQLENLAVLLGGTLGGSLPAVDAGFVPVARQVGISGKFVTPEIYLAVGMSGTPQHLAGIGPDTRIIAINKDGEADIFRFAEAGIVGEWQKVLPALLEAVQEQLAA